MGRSEEIQSNVYYAKLEDRQLSVSRGGSGAIAEALVEQSIEPDISAFYPRDSGQRFPNIEAANRWLEADPTKVVYTLKLARAANLAGLIWIEDAANRVHGADKLFNMRMYEASRGRDQRGLAVEFGAAALADYEALGNDGDIGAILNRDDLVAIRTHYELDFHEVTRPKVKDKRTKLIRAGFLSRASGFAERNF